tara:strand:- start:169250 stop:169822 length:573 start_codon:yes stop_codon:yes gene_type:complete
MLLPLLCGGFVLLCGANAYAAEDRGISQLDAAPQARGDLLPTPENVSLESSRRLFSEAEIKLLQELDIRRIELERREQALRVREKLADLAEAELKDRVEKMNELQKQLTVLLKNLSNKEEAELVQLAKIYEEMRPNNAAIVLNKLDDNIVFDLFKRMNRKDTAKIMEKMDPIKARRISKMLAEKSDLPQF